MIHRAVFQSITIYVNQKIVDHGAKKIIFPLLFNHGYGCCSHTRQYDEGKSPGARYLVFSKYSYNEVDSTKVKKETTLSET